MATNAELARLMTYKAAVLTSQGRPYTIEASMAKLFATEVAVRAADEAVGIFGLDSQVSQISRLFRNGKIHTIGEGTSEILRLVIGRFLGC